MQTSTFVIRKVAAGLCNSRVVEGAQSADRCGPVGNGDYYECVRLVSSLLSPTPTTKKKGAITRRVISAIAIQTSSLRRTNLPINCPYRSCHLIHAPRKRFIYNNYVLAPLTKPIISCEIAIVIYKYLLDYLRPLSQDIATDKTTAAIRNTTSTAADC